MLEIKCFLPLRNTKIYAVKEPKEESQRNSKNLDFVDAVSVKNVEMTLENIRNQSVILKEMEENKEIAIVGAMYDISDGKVTFM